MKETRDFKQFKKDFKYFCAHSPLIDGRLRTFYKEELNPYGELLVDVSPQQLPTFSVKTALLINSILRIYYGQLLSGAFVGVWDPIPTYRIHSKKFEKIVFLLISLYEENEREYMLKVVNNTSRRDYMWFDERFLDVAHSDVILDNMNKENATPILHEHILLLKGKINEDIIKDTSSFPSKDLLT